MHAAAEDSILCRLQTLALVHATKNTSGLLASSWQGTVSQKRAARHDGWLHGLLIKVVSTGIAQEIFIGNFEEFVYCDAAEHERTGKIEHFLRKQNRKKSS